MGDLGFYFKMGWQHIIDWNALDHLLFVLALTAIYLIGNWKQVLVLVTAFTIGHSLTLALSVYDLMTSATAHLMTAWRRSVKPLALPMSSAWLSLKAEPADLRIRCAGQ